MGKLVSLEEVDRALARMHSELSKDFNGDKITAFKGAIDLRDRLKGLL